MFDVISQKLPSFRVTEFGVDLLQLAINDVEPFDRRQLVAKSRETEMRAWGNERINLCGREVVQQTGHEIIHSVQRQGLPCDQ
jgi:hypothetical protein